MSRRNTPGGREPNDWNDESLESIESTIRAAGTYVVPSENLRPKTLEAARERCDERRGEVQFGRFVIATAFACAAMIVLINWMILWRDRHPFPSPSSVQSRAMEIAIEEKVGIDWGLVESFRELRLKRSDSSGSRASALPQEASVRSENLVE